MQQPKPSISRWIPSIVLLLSVVSSSSASSLDSEDPPFKNPYRTRSDYAALYIIDADTGTVLHKEHPYVQRAPASLVKMMTLLLLLEALDGGQASLEERVTVPWVSSKIGGSGVGLRSSEKLSLEDTAKAMVISSGNDAAIAIAEHIAGTEMIFVTRMNRRARELGMSSTKYINAHGLDGWRMGSYTTAEDQATLALELLKHPQTLGWCSNRSLTIRGTQAITNTNKLIGRFEGMDGIKTGFTGKAGFCLVATAKRDGLRLISVLLGASTNEARFRETGWALSQKFHEYKSVVVFEEGSLLEQSLPVENGAPDVVSLEVRDPLRLLMRRDREPNLRVAVLAEGATAPISKGTHLTSVEVFDGDSLVARTEAYAALDVTKLGFWDRLRARFSGKH